MNSTLESDNLIVYNMRVVTGIETLDQKGSGCRVPSTILNFLRAHNASTLECEYFGPEIGHFSHSLHYSLSHEFPRTTRLNQGLWERVEGQCSQLGTIIHAPEMESNNYARILTVEIPLQSGDVAETLAPLMRLAAKSKPRNDITQQISTHMPQLLDEFNAPGKLRIVFGEGKPEHLFQWYCQFEFVASG